MQSEIEGKVLKSTGSFYEVFSADGSIYSCKLKGIFRIQNIRSTNPIAVGDNVLFVPNKDKLEGIITEILPRNNYLIRKSINLSKASHIIASNIDKMYIICSIFSPKTSTGFIDRLLINAEEFHIPTGIIFNKWDIYDDEAKYRFYDLEYIYSKIGYNVIATSAITGFGVDILKEELKNKITLFTGHSGVGKSALLNKIFPKLELKTGEISKYHKKGMHTTTFAQMHNISNNTFIIDTPGIKEFGLLDFDKYDIPQRYPEFRKLAHNCRFNNCTHVHEPDCAIIKALADGEISKERYSNYLGILDDFSN